MSKADRSDWNALSRLAALVQESGLMVTSVVGRQPPTDNIATDEFGNEAIPRDSADFGGFEGVVTSDGERHHLDLT